MAISRYAVPIDGTIPVQALVYDQEVIQASQDGVGIYDGNEKSPDHQFGSIHVSSHRLFYVDFSKPSKHSFAMDLSYITQTDYYAGLFTSSSKVTLHLVTSTSSSSSYQDSWECEVCAYRNPPSASRVCSLCGVPRSSSSLPPSASASTANVSLPEPPPSENHTQITCPACTYLNPATRRTCEICSTALPGGGASSSSKSAPASRPGTPGLELIKISFRRGGEKSFYAVLKRCLRNKAWEDAPVRQGANNRSGISGILQNVESTVESQNANMSSALQDLEALMVKAKDMVKLAADLNERLTASTSTSSSSLPVEPEEATFIRSSLSQLGLQMTDAAVTQDMMKDERRWIESLARELSRVLQGIMKDRGIIALDEVWGGWNRARGVALIPPSTFLLVVPLLPFYTTPSIGCRTLSSGLKVLHTPQYTHAAFAARLSGVLALGGPKTTREIAELERQEQDGGGGSVVTVGLAQELVEAVEADGSICRDESGTGAAPGEVLWWANVWQSYVWDGQA